MPSIRLCVGMISALVLAAGCAQTTPTATQTSQGATSDSSRYEVLESGDQAQANQADRGEGRYIVGPYRYTPWGRAYATGWWGTHRWYGYGARPGWWGTVPYVANRYVHLGSYYYPYYSYGGYYYPDYSAPFNYVGGVLTPYYTARPVVRSYGAYVVPSRAVVVRGPRFKKKGETKD